MNNNINEVLDRIKKSGLFKSEQLGVIEYAIYKPELNTESVKLIIDPSIPSEYMSMYIRLMIKGIDIRKYIKRNWELIEIPVFDLENTIIAENKKNINSESTPIENTNSAIIKKDYPIIEKPKQKKIRRA